MNTQYSSMKKPRVVVITGPTASGKSALGMALAQQLEGEIISADSMQIYRGLDVGTAKPSAAEQAAIPHHMIDIRDPGDDFSLADYLELARDAIQSVLERGHQPIIVGGTGLYISSLVEGIKLAGEAADSACREKLELRSAAEGLEALHAELTAIDPDTASAIHPNNRKRLLRALEIYYSSGLTPSEHNARSQASDSAWDFRVFLLRHEREALYRRIERRVDLMLQEGVLDEAAWLRNLHLPEDSTCLQAIGYKEFFPYLEGKASLDECVVKLKTSSRRYAKRQLTWFRPREWVEYLDVDQDPAASDQLIRDTLIRLG